MGKIRKVFATTFYDGDEWYALIEHTDELYEAVVFALEWLDNIRLRIRGEIGHILFVVR
jgi:hypothetical protein